MGWTYSAWATRQESVPAASLTTTSIVLAGDHRELVGPSESVRIDSGSGVGTYTVRAVSYQPDQTTVEVDGTINISEPGAPSLLIGPNQRTRLRNLRLHAAEVSAAIQASVGSNGASYNAQTLEAYLRGVVLPELGRYERAQSGGIRRGRVWRC